MKITTLFICLIFKEYEFFFVQFERMIKYFCPKLTVGASIFPNRFCPLSKAHFSLHRLFYFIRTVSQPASISAASFGAGKKLFRLSNKLCNSDSTKIILRLLRYYLGLAGMIYYSEQLYFIRQDEASSSAGNNKKVVTFLKEWISSPEKTF